MANYLNRCNETLMPQAAEFTMNKPQLINLAKFFSVFTGGRSITDPANPPPEGQTMQHYYNFVDNNTTTADTLKSHVRANMVQAAKVFDLALSEAQKTITEKDAALVEVEQWTQAHETLVAERDSLKEQLDELKDDYEKVNTEKEKVKEEARLSVFNKQAELNNLNDQLLTAREGQDQVRIKQLSDLMLQTQREINSLKAELEDVETTETREERVRINNKRFDGKLDKNLPKFGGNSTDNYDDWIFLVESYKKFNGVKDEQMMGLILPLVRGQALQILKRMLLTDIDVSWSSYKKELKLTYQTDTKSRKLRKELKELKQGNDFDGFLTKFRTLSNQLPDMSEKEMLEHFIDALKPKLRYELIKDKIEDLQEAMRTARIFEECHNNFNEKRNELKTKINNKEDVLVVKEKQEIDQINKQISDIILEPKTKENAIQEQARYH
jgi:predicted transcriptional regulator